MHQASAAKQASFGDDQLLQDRRVLEPCLFSQARLVATAGEAFSTSVAGSHERAKPQSLNEGSPRDERFS
jgi:hypothetical protein